MNSDKLLKMFKEVCALPPSSSEDSIRSRPAESAGVAPLSPLAPASEPGLLEKGCRQGKCDPTHPLHCCHFVVAEEIEMGNYVLRGWVCLDCQKSAKKWMRLKVL